MGDSAVRKFEFRTLAYPHFLPPGPALEHGACRSDGLRHSVDYMKRRRVPPRSIGARGIAGRLAGVS